MSADTLSVQATGPSPGLAILAVICAGLVGLGLPWTLDVITRLISGPRILAAVGVVAWVGVLVVAIRSLNTVRHAAATMPILGSAASAAELIVCAGVLVAGFYGGMRLKSGPM